MTRYRIMRKGVSEFLSWEGTPTKDAQDAVTFDSYTEAVIFLLEMLDESSLWTVVPVFRCHEVAA